MASPSLNLSNLPEDIMYGVMVYMEPIAILRLRQVCVQYSLLTQERTVWTHAYRNSLHFLPPGPLPTQTVSDLECLLIRASKLDANWNSPSPQPLSKRVVRAPVSVHHSPAKIKLYQGRFLLLGTHRSLLLHDLDAPNWSEPIFSVDSQSSQFIDFYTSEENGGDQYLASIKVSNRTQYSVVIWKFLPGEEIPLVSVAETPLRTALVGLTLKLAHHFLLQSGRLDPLTKLLAPQLFHIPTGVTYHFPPPELQTALKEPPYFAECLISPQHVIVMRISMSEVAFETFALPRIDALGTDTPDTLERTHFGIFAGSFTEPSIIAASEGVDGLSLHLSLLVTLNRARPRQMEVQVISMALNADGSITFDPSDFPTASNGYNLKVTPSGRGTARAVSMLEVPTQMARYEIMFDHNGEMTMKMGHLSFDRALFGRDMAFDGFRGRICLTQGSDVEILDFV